MLCGWLGPALPAEHLILLGLGSEIAAVRVILIFSLQETTTQFVSFGKSREFGGVIGCFRGMKLTFARGLWFGFGGLI